ncbi:MAG: HD-GYP domain-containing protein [Pseudomonadota bacterium]
MTDPFGTEKREYAPENLVQVPAAKVEIGMFVAELDRPWIETPFLLQGFEVRSRSQIRTLMNYCQHVYVLKEGAPRKVAQANLPRLEPPPKKNTGTLLPRALAKRKVHAKRPVLRSRPPYEAGNPVRAEHAVARRALEGGRVNIKALLQSAQTGQMLDTDLAEATVASCVNTILANPEAMLWMTRIKHRNDYTAEHCLNVCVLAIAFGRHLRMEERELHLLGLCGLLHDVGKMQIPPEILDKPGRLTLEEFEIMKGHTLAGYRLLGESGERLPELALDVALNHHERPDGSGYPRGLRRDELAEFSRIIAIVDTYDAITSNRCYAPEQPSADAQKIIFQNRGGQFDEELALHFIQAIGPYPPGTLVELRNGMVGIVLAGKPRFRHLPTVLLLRDADKSPIEERTVELDRTDSGELSKEFLIRRTHPDGSFGLSVRDYRVRDEPIFL